VRPSREFFISENLALDDTLDIQLGDPKPTVPLGGQYVWNDEYKTYQSSRMGNAGSQRSLEIFPTALQELNGLRFGVGFENDGIRARGEQIRKT